MPIEPGNNIPVTIYAQNLNQGEFGAATWVVSCTLISRLKKQLLYF